MVGEGGGGCCCHSRTGLMHIALNGKLVPRFSSFQGSFQRHLQSRRGQVGGAVNMVPGVTQALWCCHCTQRASEGKHGVLGLTCVLL